MGLLFRAHPWHGIDIADDSPEIVNAYVEMTPIDPMKYELDKSTGHLKVDRPQQFSSMVPMLYGLIPKTYCGKRVADYCNEKTHRNDILGDDDPLDICILTERHIAYNNILVSAVPIGGFRMIDGDEADDKIIAFLKGDLVYSLWNDIDDVPTAFVERLRHYFLTYKDIPGTKKRKCEITHTYGKEEAHEVIRRSCADYADKFKDLKDWLTAALKKSYRENEIPAVKGL
jgi:inorganic pyrophosphatase